ncbi:MFS transporter [Paracoccus sp. R12_1]|uniref:MFS transporter n=1 Tax=unclassified Paracoccus (in: a-proteobacteria) TaxID=2688777 RepID=UPI001ADA41FF|nr:MULTISPECIES: MFS transporter [unclassified Paracoccus (in: a-proteobacteria)]MBO9455709.1 MFS transporter [Paracoccus sp. R12_2]MBO9487142.1 MFS transporter [Paracoccus sp. R12_1]
MLPPITPTEPSVWRDPRAIALMIAASLTVMTAATISPALPGLEQQFPISETNAFLVRMLVPAPSLAVVLLAPFCGAMADRSGRRRMLLGGLILFILAGSAGLVLPTLPLILVSRLGLGVALAMIMTTQSALLGDYFSGRALQKVSSGQVSARNFGGLVFILLAGLLATLGPRLPFAIYALPLLILPFFWRVIVEPQRHVPAMGTAALPGTGTSQRRVILLACGQMAVTMLFFVIPTQLPFFLAARGYTSPAMTGAALGTLMLAGGVMALLYPRLRDRIGNSGNWAFGFGLMAAGFAVLVAIRAELAVYLGTAAIGAGYALAIPGFVVLSLAATPPDRRGRTGALLTGSVFLGQFLSPVLSSPALAHWGWHSSGLGLAVVLTTAAAIAGITAMVPPLRARG